MGVDDWVIFGQEIEVYQKASKSVEREVFGRIDNRINSYQEALGKLELEAQSRPLVEHE